MHVAVVRAMQLLAFYRDVLCEGARYICVSVIFSQASHFRRRLHLMHNNDFTKARSFKHTQYLLRERGILWIQPNFYFRISKIMNRVFITKESKVKNACFNVICKKVKLCPCSPC